MQFLSLPEAVILSLFTSSSGLMLPERERESLTKVLSILVLPSSLGKLRTNTSWLEILIAMLNATRTRRLVFLIFSPTSLSVRCSIKANWWIPTSSSVMTKTISLLVILSMSAQATGLDKNWLFKIAITSWAHVLYTVISTPIRWGIAFSPGLSMSNVVLCWICPEVLRAECLIWVAVYSENVWILITLKWKNLEL